MGWRATWLADAFRAEGLTVVEVEGWKTRGVDFPDPPLVDLGHHTASSRFSGPTGGLRIVTYGREGLAGPIANWLTARNGIIYIVAAGVANNAGTGNARAAGMPDVTGNNNTLANEMENDGIGEPFPSAQRTAALRSHAAVHKKMGWPATRYIGHLEWSTTGKIDPYIVTWGPMSAARTQLAAIMAGEVEPAMELTDLLPNAGAGVTVGGALAELYLSRGGRGQITRTLDEVIATRAGVTGALTVLGRIDALDDDTKTAIDAARTELAAQATAEQLRFEQLAGLAAEIKAAVAALEVSPGEPISDDAGAILARLDQLAGEIAAPWRAAADAAAPE